MRQQALQKEELEREARRKWKELNTDTVKILKNYAAEPPFGNVDKWELVHRVSTHFDKIVEYDLAEGLWLRKKAEVSFPDTVRGFLHIESIIRNIGNAYTELNLDREFKNRFGGIAGYCRERKRVWLLADREEDIAFHSEEEEAEITSILREYDIHPLTGQGAILTDKLTGETYELSDYYVGWGQVDDAATYGGICLKSLAHERS